MIEPHSVLPNCTRRNALQILGIAGLAGLAATTVGPGIPAAFAATRALAGPTLTDFGPASSQLIHYGGVVAADGVLYVGSRNMDPTKVFGIDLATGRAVSETRLGYMNAVMAMAVDPTGRYVYAGGDHQQGVATGNLYRIDTQAAGRPAEDLSLTQENIQSISVAPDGVVFFGGRWTPTTAYQWDPVTRETRQIGTLPATMDRIVAVAATGTTLFAGGVMRGSTERTEARLFAIDRATGVTTDVTPPEVLAAGSGIRDLDVVGDRLFVGVTSFVAPTPLVVMDAADPSSYRVAQVAGTEVREFCRLGDRVYWRSGAYDLTAGAVEKFPVTALPGPGVLSLSEWNGKLVGVAAGGFGYVFDVDARTVQTIRFLEAGVTPGPQLVLGVAAGGGYAYACSNLQLTRHDLDTGEVVDFPMNGESKSAVYSDGVVWFAQYGGGGLWGYDPRTNEPPKLIAPFPALQNRGLRVAVDEVNDLVLVGVQSDRLGGGSLCVYHRGTRALEVHENPIAIEQVTRAVTCHEGIAYLGGENLGVNGTQATIVAFDPVAGTELWRVETGQPRGIGELAVLGRHLYGISHRGGLFVIDLTTRQVVHTSDISAICPDQATLITNRNAVYGLSGTTFFRIDPVAFSPTVVVDELDGGWYGWPRIDTDEQGRFYLLRERNLVRVDLGPQYRAETSTRTVGGKVLLAVKAVNDEQVPVTFTFETAYGSKTITDVAPGRHASHVFTTRQASLPAGTVRVTATVIVDGAANSASSDVPYEAS